LDRQRQLDIRHRSQDNHAMTSPALEAKLVRILHRCNLVSPFALEEIMETLCLTKKERERCQHTLKMSHKRADRFLNRLRRAKLCIKYSPSAALTRHHAEILAVVRMCRVAQVITGLTRSLCANQLGLLASVCAKVTRSSTGKSNVASRAWQPAAGRLLNPSLMNQVDRSQASTRTVTPPVAIVRPRAIGSERLN
jgi:hypothetical protein